MVNNETESSLISKEVVRSLSKWSLWVQKKNFRTFLFHSVTEFQSTKFRPRAFGEKPSTEKNTINIFSQFLYTCNRRVKGG